MEGEKDNFWVYIAGIIVLAIVLVFMLKSREMESVPSEGYKQLKGEVEQQIQKAK
ncbi:MAG TPA: LPXTG cell wall anchor domain-containing protein [Methylococcaceae bacterium]|jgi:LPXTG-motif cell wall-anchored protein|nr:LPXTG cell wall anchor domain-containing protein [Methylococcaceae bacterium]